VEEVTSHLSLRVIRTLTCYYRPMQGIWGIGDSADNEQGQ
jgi:hypothetical protein